MCSENSLVVEDKQRNRSKSVGVRNKKRSSDNERKQESIRISSLRQSRKSSRTKTRKKPKYLSLKLELKSSHEQTDKKNMRKQGNKPRNKKKKQKIKPKTTTSRQQINMKQRREKDLHQLNLFPQHPENLVEKESYQYDAVTEYLFNSAVDTTIHDLLDSTVTTSDDGGGRFLSPFHHRHDHHDHGSSSSSLVRTAMRRGASQEIAEERWVSYSEVVEEAVLSRSGTPRCGVLADGVDQMDARIGRSSLALKLDYDQIMEAWSDKGTLYIDGEPPQTVPCLHSNAVMEGCVGNLWAVPEMEMAEGWMKGRREASLMRYKEKRQSRLFSKRIRYEVRKLNAEKRPRIKGRFVKRVDT